MEKVTMTTTTGTKVSIASLVSMATIAADNSSNNSNNDNTTTTTTKTTTIKHFYIQFTFYNPTFPIFANQQFNNNKYETTYRMCS